MRLKDAHDSEAKTKMNCRLSTSASERPPSKDTLQKTCERTVDEGKLRALATTHDDAFLQASWQVTADALCGSRECKRAIWIGTRFQERLQRRYVVLRGGNPQGRAAEEAGTALFDAIGAVAGGRQRSQYLGSSRQCCVLPYQVIYLTRTPAQ